MQMATRFQTDPFAILDRTASYIDAVYLIAAEHLRAVQAREANNG